MKHIYKCGHDNSPIVIERNDITMVTRYYNWAIDVKHQENICFWCYNKTKD